MRSLIFQTISRVVLYLLLLLSFFLLMQGHNAPGGGFVGGLLAATGIVLQLLAFDLDYVERVFPLNWVKVTGAGLLTAVTVGIIPKLLGYPFLTSTFRFFTVPVLGHIELTSALFFDIGVYLTVFGAVMTIIVEIARDRNFAYRAREIAHALKEDAEIWKS